MNIALETGTACGNNVVTAVVLSHRCLPDDRDLWPKYVDNFDVFEVLTVSMEWMILKVSAETSMRFVDSPAIHRVCSTRLVLRHISIWTSAQYFNSDRS